MTTRTTAEKAERLSRRRARMLPFLAVIYLTQQISFFTAGAGDRAVDQVKIGAWVVLSLVLLAALTTKGFWFHSREVRDMVDDEVTRAHRAGAMGWGFVMAILSAIGLFFLSMYEPITTREAVHVIVSFGIAAAILRFGMLEGRALRDA